MFFVVCEAQECGLSAFCGSARLRHPSCGARVAGTLLTGTFIPLAWLGSVSPAPRQTEPWSRSSAAL